MSYLTIFTPTYNRGYLLHDLYRSLVEQTNKEFEWLIIDDESTDNTEELVKTWIAEESRFSIKYLRQGHGGKHRAINKAVDIAQGDFFFIVDSDDKLVPNAVELVYGWIDSIGNDNTFAGVAGLKVSKNGEVWGGKTKISGEYVDATDFERRKYKLKNDKAEIYKTDILRNNKFPEFDDEYFVTEDVCWLNISYQGYKIRWFNAPIYICEYLSDGLTNGGANDIAGHKKNYKGYCFYISAFCGLWRSLVRCPAVVVR